MTIAVHRNVSLTETDFNITVVTQHESSWPSGLTLARATRAIWKIIFVTSASRSAEIGRIGCATKIKDIRPLARAIPVTPQDTTDKKI